MSAEPRRTKTRWQGQCDVEKDGTIISKVNCDVKVTSTTWHITGIGVDDYPQEPPYAEGKVSVLSGQKNLMDDDLILVCEDERKWKLRVTHYDKKLEIYTVTLNIQLD